MIKSTFRPHHGRTSATLVRSWSRDLLRFLIFLCICSFMGLFFAFNEFEALRLLVVLVGLGFLYPTWKLLKLSEAETRYTIHATAFVFTQGVLFKKKTSVFSKDSILGVKTDKNNRVYLETKDGQVFFDQSPNTPEEARLLVSWIEESLKGVKPETPEPTPAIASSDEYVYKWKNSFEGFYRATITGGFALFLAYMFILTWSVLAGIFTAIVGTIALCFIYIIVKYARNSSVYRIISGTLHISCSPMKDQFHPIEVPLTSIREIKTETFKKNNKDPWNYYRVIAETESGPRILQNNMVDRNEASDLEKWIRSKLPQT